MAKVKRKAFCIHCKGQHYVGSKIWHEHTDRYLPPNYRKKAKKK